MLPVIIISVILLTLAVAGLGIKILTTKDGEFKKTCGSTDPMTGKKIGCSCGKSDGGESCDNKDPGVRYQAIRIED